MVNTHAARLVDFESGGVERVIEVVVARSESLVVEAASVAFFVCRRGASQDEREHVATLVDHLVALFVLPSVEEGIGDYVLLLGRDLSDDDVGQTNITAAVVSVRATGLVGGAGLVGLL